MFKGVILIGIIAAIIYGILEEFGTWLARIIIFIILGVLGIGS